MLLLRSFISFLSKYRGMEILIINFMVQLPILIRTDFFAVYTRILFILVFFLFVHFVFGVEKSNTKSDIYKILIQ